jgi:hypothetical protein
MDESSIESFPSLMAHGITHLPGRVAVRAPIIKRWNAGSDVGGPRTQHIPQHKAHPILNPEHLCDQLMHHTACRGLMGPAHCAMQLALLAGEEVPARGGSAAAQTQAIHANSIKLLHNLKRRTYAEELLKRAQLENLEYEKRYWLNELMRRRADAGSARAGVSAREHAATLGASAALDAAASLEGGGGGGGGGAASVLSGRSFVAARKPLVGGAASVASLTPRTTFLPAEKGPRAPGLTQSQAAALKVASRATQWTRVQQDGNAPPAPAPFCPPRLSSTLPRSGGGVAVGSPALVAAALGVPVGDH